MLTGCYYRCPIPLEQNDFTYPRFFVLGQLKEYNALADTVQMEMYNLLSDFNYYTELIGDGTFKADEVVRCEAAVGSPVDSQYGKGSIICKAMDSTSEEEPYWYWIRLPNGRTVKCCETDLRIEYSLMNYSPLKQIRAYEFQHPTWFINRLKVSRNLHLVHNATYGFDVLAGSRAYLLPHQVSTVARCFEMLPVRYMLADEVGLGKTIEACSIYRILSDDKKDMRTMIIAPAALLSQWKSELHYKYGVDASERTYTKGVHLLAMENLSNAQNEHLINWDLIIVDETHRLLTNPGWYRTVQIFSEKAVHILLLSATPIQDRNEEYRRLLALLNPQQYANMNPEEFARMVKKQKAIQRVVNQQLRRLDRYDEYKDIIVGKLTEISEKLSDKMFAKLVEDINLSDADEGLAAVEQALAYVCENYRLERRVIRNRRKGIVEKMARRTLQAISYVPLTLNESYNELGAIQDALDYLIENGEDEKNYIDSTAIPLLSALFSSPWAYDGMLKKLHIHDETLLNGAAEWKQAATKEHSRVNTILDKDPEQISGRLMKALDYMEQETEFESNPECKIVVFTAFTETLQAFANLFERRFAKKGIQAVCFSADMNREALEDSVYAFQNEDSCRVIICDETGGEGRNFQNAAMIVHLDMPWNANALEQRIGRLDRLGRDPEMDVCSVVLYAEHTVEEQLFHVWRDGLKLFEQSLSGLEIITGELNALISEALLDDYYNGLANAFDDILDQADEMRESVEDEQDFDLGAALYRPLNQGVENVLSLYSEEDDNLFAQAMVGWGNQAGLTPHRVPHTSLVEYRASDFSIRAAWQSCYIPPRWEQYATSSMMKRTGTILGTFDRHLASLREDILFYAPRDTIYDSIIMNASGCSRGQCAAMGITGEFNYEGLVFIFNIYPQLDALLEQKIGTQMLSQYRMYLPLRQITVAMPLTAASREIPEDSVIQLMSEMRMSYHIEHLGKRSKPLNGYSNLERFMTRIPPTTWETLVDKAYSTAYKLAQKRLKEHSDIASARKEMQRVLNGYRAEYMFFGKDLKPIERKKEQYELTYQALISSKPVLDAVCYLRVRKDEHKQDT